MQEARVRLLRDDQYSGVTFLLGAYGGMGSFNDLVLGNDPSNTRFEQLRERAWALADQMRASLAEPD